MRERVKFYVDEHVPNAVAKGLLRRGVDVLTTHGAGMLGAADEVQLAFARSAGRVLFTKDDDFLKLHHRGIPHAGIVFGHQQITIGGAIRGLMLIHEVIPAGEMVNWVEFL